MRKISTAIAGSVLAAGVAAGLFGAGTASAAPGAEVSVGGHQVGIGDRTDSGAQARSTTGNVSVAVSTFSPSRANANGTGRGNVALAADSGTEITHFGANVYGGNNNLVIASPLSGAHVVNGDRNIVASSLGVSGQFSGDDNRVFSVGSNAQSFDGASDRTVVAVCGASVVSAQGASITSNC
jgi:hypothetical protein